MRAKIILPVSILALVLLASAVYLRYVITRPAPLPQEAVDDATNAAPSALPPILHRVATVTQAHDNVAEQADPAADPKSPDHEEYVERRNAELYQLGLSQDPSALHSILSELSNPEASIRSSAVTAAMDIGSKDAIPALKNQMTWAEDPKEKIEIQKAINFLELPPYQLDDNGSLPADPNQVQAKN